MPWTDTDFRTHTSGSQGSISTQHSQSNNLQHSKLNMRFMTLSSVAIAAIAAVVQASPALDPAALAERNCLTIPE